MQTSPHNDAPRGHGPDESTMPLSRMIAPSGRAIGAPQPATSAATTTHPSAVLPCETDRDCNTVLTVFAVLTVLTVFSAVPSAS